ncbi:MAG TPA: fibronectin type III domain-containing protein, partial [Candidatus Polarisedimenticolia bacterium]|nr:fibronectin type III domain-containing protein [Candidatus Polarisedimenticolia bacterium]
MSVQPRVSASAIASLLLVVALAAIPSTAIAGSNDLLVSWAANTEPDLAGYVVSYGLTPGSHPTSVNVGNVTATRLTGLTTGLTYYIVVQAYDGAGNTSGMSAEVTGIPGGAAGPSLTLSMSDSPDPIAPGANITYTINWSNAGSAPATGVVLTDIVPVNTSFVSATGGATQVAGTVTWTIGTLAAGGSGSAQLVVRANTGLANGTVLTNAAAGIDSVETPSIGAGTITTTVSAMPILSISKTDGPDPVAAGSNITYTLSYANNGIGGATGVVVSDTLPANTTFVSA